MSAPPYTCTEGLVYRGVCGDGNRCKCAVDKILENPKPSFCVQNDGAGTSAGGLRAAFSFLVRALGAKGWISRSADRDEGLCPSTSPPFKESRRQASLPPTKTFDVSLLHFSQKSVRSAPPAPYKARNSGPSSPSAPRGCRIRRSSPPPKRGCGRRGGWWRAGGR